MKPPTRALTLLMVLALTVTACGTDAEGGDETTAPSTNAESPSTTAVDTTTGETQPESSETIVFSNLIPYTGQNAAFGPWLSGSCWIAADVINAEGGVLGSQISCDPFDTAGNPTQAVTVTQQMIAATSNLAAVVGVSSDEAQVSAPIINEAEIPFFAVTGLVDFNETDMEYFWRTAPADSDKGIAMSLVARTQGYENAVIVATDDAGAQSIVDGTESTFTELGGQVVLNLGLAAGQSSYRTEAQQILDSGADVILTETDARTAATLFGQMLELSGGLLPVIGSELVFEPSFVDAVTQAVGDDLFYENFVSVTPAPGEIDASAMDVFVESAVSSENVASVAAEGIDGEYLSVDPFAMGWYDEVNILALAIEAAGSTDGPVFNEFIKTVTEPSDGKTVVYTYADGKAALEVGESIQYVGPGGPYVFNDFHNSTQTYAAIRLAPDGTTETVQVVTTEEFAELGG